jgi:hypothetical protein
MINARLGPPRRDTELGRSVPADNGRETEWAPSPSSSNPPGRARRVGLSAASVVLTGYLGRIMDAVWLGWIPGTVMMAVGFAIPPVGDEPGSALIFVGGLVLIGWPIYFLPLIALGVWLQRKRVAPA